MSGEVSVAIGGENVTESRSRRRFLPEGATSRREDFAMFANDEEFQIRISLIAQCVFILVNYLQQVAIISSPDLIGFPSEWLDAFGWLSVTALLDFRVLFGAENELALVFQIAVSTVIPLGIICIVMILLLQPAQRESILAVVSLVSLITCVVFFLRDLSSAVNPFIGTCAALLPAWACIRYLVGKYIRYLRHKGGVDYAEIDDDLTSVEIYGWLFLLVTVYSSVFKTGLSFISSADAFTSNAVNMTQASTKETTNNMLFILGISLPLGTALVLILFVFDRARRAQRQVSKADEVEEQEQEGADEPRRRNIDSGSFVVRFFKVQFWYFQIVLMMDKSVHLLINLVSDPVTAASITLVYIVLFIVFLVAVKPYNEDQVVPGTPLTAGNIDVLGRTSNLIILVMVILFNVLQDDGAKVILTIVTFCLSAVTGLFWMYILIYKLQVVKTIADKYENLGYQASWIGVERHEVASRIKGRQSAFTRGEALVLTEAQCAWICETGGISSSAVFTSLLKLRAEDMLSATSLVFAANMTLDESSVQGLLLCLRRSRSITEVRVPASGINDKGSRRVAKVLMETTHVVQVNGLSVPQLKGNEATATLDFQNSGLAAFETVVIAEMISSNPHLTNLNLSNNQIGGAGASAIGEALGLNESIETLSLQSVGLETAGLAALCVGLLENGGLTDIDLGGNQFDDEGTNALADGLFTHPQLVTLRLGNTRLGDYGKQGLARLIESNVNIQTLYFEDMSINSNLESFVAANTNLNSADAVLLAAFLQRTSTRWRTLRINNNVIGEEGANAIFKALQNNGTLLTLDISGNRITGEGTALLGSALAINGSLQLLLLDMNPVGDEGAIAVAEAIAHNKTLQRLSMKQASIGNDGAMALGLALKENTKLKALLLAKNRIGSRGAQSIAEGLAANRCIELLDLDLNRVGNAGARSIGSALDNNTSIKTLMLEANGIGGEGAIALSHGLKGNGSLALVKLARNQIGDDGRNALADAMEVNETLEELRVDDLTLDAKANGLSLTAKSLRDADVRLIFVFLRRAVSCWRTLLLLNSKFSDVGITALADAIASESKLETLTLKQNELGDAKTKSLAPAIERNVSLRSLSLEWQTIGDAGAIALAQAVQKNTALVTLNLWKNRIGDAGGQALGEALKENSSLRSLRLRKNRIGDAGTAAISEGLQRNNTLTSLDLSENYNGDSAAIALGQALKSCALQELSLTRNRIGDEGARALAEGAKLCASLKELKLGANKIGDDGARTLQGCLLESSSLKSISLGSNNVTESVKAELVSGIKWTV